ncbi:MAG: hypothetical protein LBQ13_00585 [Endomicrobium sp.]|jgi:hypothetical protein|nr:hypothetical protein [Endomicrobium sp.]
MTNINPKDEKQEEKAIPSAIVKKTNRAIRQMYKKLKDYYWEKAAEDMGVFVKDYYSPDGHPLADLSFYANDDEIDERALEYFIEDMTNEEKGLSSEVFQYFEEDEDRTEEEEILESKYLDSLNYSDYEKIINNN